MSGNVVSLHGRRAETSDLAEAFAIAALLIQDWMTCTDQVRHQGLVLVDRDCVPLPDPYPREPVVRFAGSDLPASEIVALAHHLIGQPLPPVLFVIFAIWNSDDPEAPVLTYADAIEFTEALVDCIRLDQQEAPARRGGAA